MPCFTTIAQIFLYSNAIYKDAGTPDEYVPFAVIGTNAVNVAMTLVAVVTLI